MNNVEKQRIREILEEEGVWSLAKRAPRYGVEQIESQLEDIAAYPRRMINKRAFNDEYGEPLDVVKQDWDNLIILDACRYDVFKDLVNFPGDLTSVVSAGSRTNEFLRYNFLGRQLHDTVYISANPHADKTLTPGVFHKLVKTYSSVRLQHRDVEEYHPSYVTDIAIDVSDEFSDKRLIIHYMQPHTPYIGTFAEKTREKLLEEKGIFVARGGNKAKISEEEIEIEYKDFLRVARHDHISDKDLRRMYEENLELVLDEVERLSDAIKGKTVITADHGELLGNPTGRMQPRIKYNHPGKTYVPELRLVPWFERPFKKRKSVQSEAPIKDDHVSTTTVHEQLEALGYT